MRSFRVKDLPNRLNNVANEKALLESERAILETAEQLRGGNLSFKGSGRHVVNYDRFVNKSFWCKLTLRI